MRPKEAHRSQSRLQAWEAFLGGSLVALSVWLAQGALPWAVAALVFGAAAVATAGRLRRARGLIMGFGGVLAALIALESSWRVRRIESDWSAVREELIQLGSEKLEGNLSDAVRAARELVATGVRVGSLDRAEAFRRLEEEIERQPLEGGVVVYREGGPPWAWAGRFRIAPLGGPAELGARITPFYAVLEAQESADGIIAMSQVVLSADSLVPASSPTVATRFKSSTGSTLEFIAPREAPPESDIFDYCVPQCRSTEVVPDTLFSVRTTPPGQGAFKLSALQLGGRRVAWIMIALGLAGLLLGSLSLKRIVVFGGAALLVWTPVGSLLGMRELFSPATYYWDALGTLSASAGALLSSAALAVMVSVALWRTQVPRTAVTFLASVLLVAGAPYALRLAARGITPPATGVGVGMWISWELAVTLMSTLIVILAAFLVRGTQGSGPGARGARSPAWMTWAACVWALVTAVLGLAIWEPSSAWPEWYTFLWVPALLLATQPAPKVRLVTSVAIVAGCASALLTWGAAVEGRLVLAERDAARADDRSDLLQASMMETLLDRISDVELPTTESDLFQLWRSSPFYQEGYPGLLVTWDPDESQVTRLEMARLDISDAALTGAIRAARDRGDASVEIVLTGVGVHRILAVPFEDGSVLTVGVGPATSLIEPTSAGFYLGPGGAARPPFELSISEPLARVPEADRISWTRQGRHVHGTRALESTLGQRSLHAEVSLRGLGQLMVRGSLIVLLDVLLIAGLWVVGEFLVGRLEIPHGLKGALQVSSYRMRLAIALGAFFVLPTIGFAAWTIGRIGSDAERNRDLLTRRTLREASRLLAAGGNSAIHKADLDSASTRLGADIALYQNGVLGQTSNSLFYQMGIYNAFLPSRVFQDLVMGDEIELTGGGVMASSSARIGYRLLGAGDRGSAVLATPGLLGDPDLGGQQEDLIFTIFLATVLGLGAAAWLAAVAARSLARPVHALQGAAAAVGRGEPITPFGPSPPAEFVPVMSAFERMERDVREHRAALESNFQFTSAVLQNVDTAIVALDAQMNVTASNRRAEELFRVPLTTELPIKNQVSEEWHELADWVTRFLAGDGATASHEFTVEFRRILARVTSFEGADGGCVLALDDATELARAERVIAWGEMARQVAHEVKNPLTPIRLGIQHLRRSRRDKKRNFDEILDRTSDQILSEIDRLDAIARAFSRFGSPMTVSESPSDVNVVEIVRETADLYAVGGGLEVELEAEGPLIALARPDELKEVLVNLVENSRDAGAQKITVSVRSLNDEQVGMVVSDDGAGIDPQVLPHIFEPQFSATTSGTGLGLAICKRLVESWGGEIGAASSPGKGTQISIRLKRSPEGHTH